MRPTVAVTADDLTDFLRLFLDRSVEVRNENQLSATLHLLGQTVNKRAPGAFLNQVCVGGTDPLSEDLGSFLAEEMPKYWEEYIASEMPAATRKAALRAWAWVRSI